MIKITQFRNLCPGGFNVARDLLLPIFWWLVRLSNLYPPPFFEYQGRRFNNCFVICRFGSFWINASIQSRPILQLRIKLKKIMRSFITSLL
jgi:hypothetical protein